GAPTRTPRPHSRRASRPLRDAATRADRLIISGSAQRSSRVPSLSRRVVISVLGAAVVAGALGVELAGRRGQFTAAIHAAPIGILSLVTLLQLVSLLARTEA